jgi:hypothetical protein
MLVTYSDNLNNELEAPALDPQFLLIANEYLAGKSIDDISIAYSLSPDRVAAICERSDTKRYIDNVIMSQGYLHRARRLKLINKIIDKKLEEAEETDVYSKKDLLDWIKLLNDLDKAQTPKSTPTTAIQVNNNYSTLMQDLLGK